MAAIALQPETAPEPSLAPVRRASTRVVVEPRLVTRTRPATGRNWALLLTFAVICGGMLTAGGAGVYGLVKAGIWAAGLV
ncbi:hypothetical protein [Rhizobium sp. SG2393]|uniref:hypothetical protein n=1 Tax=Rhizobium sp. SG2393 TaxID=3276279 RepID=UPI00366B76CB